MQKIKQECQICGYSKCKRALHFHHVSNEEKLYQPTQLVRNSLEKIKAEIKKCIVVCANCHAEIHNKD